MENPLFSSAAPKTIFFNFGTDFFMTNQEVKNEGILYNQAVSSFGTDFDKISIDNVKDFLDSTIYTY